MTAKSLFASPLPGSILTTFGRHVLFSIDEHRNGRWRSVWTYSNGELVGHWKIVVHYYEDGNVQLNTDTTQKVTVPESGVKCWAHPLLTVLQGPDAIAVAAMKAIAKTEATYQSALEANYATMGETTFKALRRALPITRQKIDWNKIKNYKIGGEMGKK